jgi:hypothetical protein
MIDKNTSAKFEIAETADAGRKKTSRLYPRALASALCVSFYVLRGAHHIPNDTAWRAPHPVILISQQ